VLRVAGTVWRCVRRVLRLNERVRPVRTESSDPLSTL
jgi:hypothetical protein